MDLRVLGPLEVHVDGHDVAVGSQMERALLTALVINANAVVSADRLSEALWGDEPPPSARNGLQTYVARLRRRLGRVAAERIVTRPPGYLLEVDAGSIDALRFEQLVDRGRRHRVADPLRALAQLDEALAMWRGPAHAEFAGDDVARAEAVRLEALRASATDERIAALLDLGRNAEAIGELETVVATWPLRERPYVQLMTAFARTGRQVEAVRLYQRYRSKLVEEVGLEPSAELRELEIQILRADPLLGDDERPRAPDVPAGNLPPEVTTFFGRDREHTELVADLGRAQLVTLVGPGGVGKSRLAVRVAKQLGEQYADGAWLVELASVSAPDAVPHAVAAALGVQPAQGRTVEQALIEFLSARQLLLVVDNCEHVLDATAPLLHTLTGRCPGLTVLATSRERLAVEGEQVSPLPPLPVPDHTDSWPGTAGATPAEALFTDRARALRPDFRLDEDTAGPVAAICRELDGMPLAIELAAARMQGLTAGDLATRLGERFGVLTSGRRDDHARHRTLQAVVDWSYELLDDRERRVFDCLSVFAGGWTLEAAIAVCSGEGISADQVVSVLASLVDKSMVLAHRGPGPGRYGLLETLRQYGVVRLTACGDIVAMQRRHADYFVSLAERADAGLCGPDEGSWVARLRAEIGNMRAVHAGCRQRDDAEPALRLSVALHRFAARQVNEEVLLWAAATVELPSADGHRLRPVVHGSAGVGAWRRGDLDGAVRHAEAGLAAATGPDEPARALPYEVLGVVWRFRGRLDEAFDASGEAARLGRLAGDDDAVVYRLLGQALARAYAGDVDAALARAEEIHELAVASGNPTAHAWDLYTRGEILLDDDPTRALDLLDRAVQIASTVDNVFLTGVALLSATSLRGRHGEAAEAFSAYREAIAHWHRHGNWTQQWITMRNLIGLLNRVGADEPAAVLYGATTASRTAPPTFGSESERLHAVVEDLTRRLGRKTFEDATERGAALADDEVVALATDTISRCVRTGVD